MSGVRELDCSALQSWAQSAVEALEGARASIDSLNVFPVPDGDTGTNVYLTMEAAWLEVREAMATERSRSKAALAMARGALLGARGNSGVILSQILQGVSDTLAALPEDAVADGPVVAALLRRGADLAYQAVARPVEGTILTVARAAADAAQEAVNLGASDASDVLVRASAAAQTALDLTPELLDSLRRAGVVDAGGQALVVVLDALRDSVCGERSGSTVARRTTESAPASMIDDHAGPAYEVMFLLDQTTSSAVATLREQLAQIGDSLVVVGDEPLFNIHVHVDDAGAAMEAASAAGRPHRVKITYLPREGHVARPGRRTVAAIAFGEGMRQVLADAGVQVVNASSGVRPSAVEVLVAIHATDATEILVLPGDSDTAAVAEIAAAHARLEGLKVWVIPTRSIVQTLAAVAVHDASARVEDDVLAMTRAAGATHYGAVTVSVRKALTSAGTCEVGDALGLVDGDIRFIGQDIDLLARQLVDSMLAAGAEILTLVLGDDASEYVRTQLPRELRAMYPLVDIITYEGGQRLWPLIVGVE